MKKNSIARQSGAKRNAKMKEYDKGESIVAIDRFNEKLIDRHLESFHLQQIRIRDEMTASQKYKAVYGFDGSIICNHSKIENPVMPKDHTKTLIQTLPLNQRNNWEKYKAVIKNTELAKSMISSFLRKMTDIFGCDNRLEFIIGELYPENIIGYSQFCHTPNEDFDKDLETFSKINANTINQMAVFRMRNAIVKVQ